MTALVLLLGVAHATDPALLILGNSYVHGGQLDQMMEDVLPGIVPGSTDFVSERRTSGGLRFVNHLARVEGREGGESNTWRSALVTGDASWDIVLLQEQSQIPGFPASEPYFIESVASAEALDEYVETHGADTVFLSTWGRREGDRQNPEMYPDFETMNGRLLDGYRTYVAETTTSDRPTHLVPVGLAFAAVRAADEAAGRDPVADGSWFASLYTQDGSHPSPVGTYLMALTVTAGISGWPTTGTPAPGDAFDAETVTALQAAADSVTVDDPWSEPLRFTATFSSGTDLVVHDAWMRRQVKVEGDVGALASVVVGDGARTDDAELHVVTGGAFVTDVVELNDGRLVVSGGSVETGAITGTGPVTVSSGTLALNGGTTGPLTIAADGALAVGGGSPDPDLVVGGAAVLDGTVTASAVDTASEQDVLLVADTLTLNGETGAPDGWELVVAETDDGRQALVAVPDGSEVDEPVDVPDDDDATADGATDDKGGSGCSTVAGTAGAAPALLALFALARRTRRRA